MLKTSGLIRVIAANSINGELNAVVVSNDMIQEANPVVHNRNSDTDSDICGTETQN